MDNLELSAKLIKDTLANPGAILGVDPKTMSVTAVLSTALEDRDQDIIEPAGIDVSEHQRNPVVFFNHFRPKAEPSLFALPIGKSEDADGRYTVKLLRDPDRLVATTYFSQRNPVAQAIFGLYEEGILRAWSIGIKPREVEPRTDVRRMTANLPVHVTKSELVEYSAVGVGSNRDALTVKLQKGFGLRGPGTQPMEMMLKAALEPYTIQPTAWSFGWEPLEKAMSEPVETHEPQEPTTQIAEKVIEKSAPVEEPKPEVIQKSASESSDMPMGAAHMSAMIDHINDGLSKVENPDVVATYKKCGKLVNKCWSKCYSAHGEKSCKGCDSEEDTQKQIQELLDKVCTLQRENDALTQKALNDAQALTKFAETVGGLRKTIFRLTGKAA